jgi:hypothetical protein
VALEPIVFETGPDAAAVLSTTLGAIQSLGFTVNPVDEWSGQAEVGSKAARALGGGFARRMVVSYQLSGGADQSSTRMVITPAVSGWSGGAMGASKAKKEMESIWSTVGGALHQAGLLRQ